MEKDKGGRQELVQHGGRQQMTGHHGNQKNQWGGIDINSMEGCSIEINSMERCSSKNPRRELVSKTTKEKTNSEQPHANRAKNRGTTRITARHEDQHRRPRDREAHASQAQCDKVKRGQPGECDK